MANSDTFFLPPVQGGALGFRPPPRQGVRVTPLIDGIDTFTAIEEAIAAATTSIHFAMWIFKGTVRVQSKNVQRQGPRTWADLLEHAAKRGVQVRLILSDFDPILQTSNHAMAWKAYRLLFQKASSLGASQSKLQVICSRHSAVVHVGAESLLRSPFKERINELNNELRIHGRNKAKLEFSVRPGLWRNVVLPKVGPFTEVPHPEWTVFVGAHHQKLCVVDATVAFVGGLDVNTGRLDSSRHIGSLWHDIHARVEGPIVADMERAFVGRWNEEEPLFREFVEAANEWHTGFRIPRVPTTQITAALPAPPPKVGVEVAQMHRTVSVNWVSTVPAALRRDIEEAYESAIRNAEHFVYLETQYLRSPAIAAWLITRREIVPNLQLIVLLPVAPEEVSSAGGADPLTEHGLYLQHDIVMRLQSAFGPDAGFYSMVAPRRATQNRATNDYGSFQIYVHSKCLIVDDQYLSIGSANANGRSFQVDTEMSVGVYDRILARGLRIRLWLEVLGSESGVASWQTAEFVKHWGRIAAKNRNVKPSGRSGFVVPHQSKRFPGKQNSLVPDEFAELHNLDQDRSPSSSA
jgi:phospholipase D1/2